MKDFRSDAPVYFEDSSTLPQGRDSFYGILLLIWRLLFNSGSGGNFRYLTNPERKVSAVLLNENTRFSCFIEFANILITYYCNVVTASVVAIGFVNLWK